MILTPEQERYVRLSRVGRLATTDERGCPHIVPVCFAYEQGSFYTAIDLKPKAAAPAMLRRVRNISVNPQAALLIDHYEEEWDNLSYLLVRATASVVEDEEERTRAVRALRARYEQYRTLLGDGAMVIRLMPFRVSAWAASGRLRGSSAIEAARNLDPG